MRRLFYRKNEHQCRSRRATRIFYESINYYSSTVSTRSIFSANFHLLKIISVSTTGSKKYTITVSTQNFPNFPRKVLTSARGSKYQKKIPIFYYLQYFTIVPIIITRWQTFIKTHSGDPEYGVSFLLYSSLGYINIVVL